jgi:hypothetical protein
VQVYYFFNQGTIEDTVQSYFEKRLRRSADALAKVTGEDPEEIRATLYGQTELDPKEIYKRAIVEGNLNRQSQKEIEEAVDRAKRAYEIATRSLFRDVSSYSFDNYQRDLATDLSLSDLARFADRFLTAHRRQLSRKGEFVEFIVPEVLQSFDLPERYRERCRHATFDRSLAIARPDVDFLAIGNPIVDAMLQYAGSYDFGGLTASRQVASEKCRGKSGFLFIFVVRERITRDGGGRRESALARIDRRSRLAHHPLARSGIRCRPQAPGRQAPALGLGLRRRVHRDELDRIRLIGRERAFRASEIAKKSALKNSTRAVQGTMRRQVISGW